MKKRLLIETCQVESYWPVMDSLVLGCSQLGYEIERWDRHHPIRNGCILIWWGCNVTLRQYTKLKQAGAQCVYLERGWTLDRHGCFQLDRQGSGGLASWAEEPLLYEPAGPMRVKRTGPLLVVLRFERATRPTDNVERLCPHIRTNLEWLEHLGQVEGVGLRIRPHPDTVPQMNAPLQRMAEARGWQWDDNTSFTDAAAGSKAVLVQDSTAGVQAMELGRPVLCFGRQVYKHPGAVFCLDADVRKTQDAVQQLETGQVLDKGAVAAMLTRIRGRQYYPKDQATFPERLKNEVGL